MTISSEVSRNDYVGNGATSVYPYTFRIIASSDLLVTWADTAGVETILTLDVDYTVSGVGSGGGGNVTLTGGNLTSGYALTIRRVRPLTQETDVRNQGAFYPETHEDAFDHQIMVSQQLDDSMERALKLPETEAGTSASTTIPGADSRANMVLGFDASGNPVAVSNVPTSAVSVSAFMQTVLDDADAVTARATLIADNPKGTTAARPAFGNAGRFYINTTTGTLQRDSGTAWEDVGTVADLGITTAKLANDAVTTAKIADGQITAAKMYGKIEVVPFYSGDFSSDVLIRSIPQFPFTSPAKLSNPATLPGGDANDCAFSPNGEFFAVGHATTPFVTIYQRTGNTFVKLANPATLPTGAVNACAFSPNGEFLAVAHNVAPGVTIYQRSGSTFTKLTNPATLPFAGYGCAFSPNGEYLAVADASSPYVLIYQRSGTTFTKLADPATLPTGPAWKCSFSPSGEFLCVPHQTSPYLTIYQRSGATFTKLSNPASLPAGNGWSSCFSRNSEFLVIGHASSPYLTIYQRSGTTFTKLSNPASLPPGDVMGCDFSPNGEFLFAASSSTSYVSIYQRSGTTFTKQSNPASLPAGPAYGCAVSPTCEFLAYVHDTTPYVTIYQTASDMPENGVAIISGVDRAGT